MASIRTSPGGRPRCACRHRASREVPDVPALAIGWWAADVGDLDDSVCRGDHGEVRQSLVADEGWRTERD